MTAVSRTALHSYIAPYRSAIDPCPDGHKVPANRVSVHRLKSARATGWLNLDEPFLVR